MRRRRMENQGEYEYALRVLRLPPASPSLGPSRPLRELPAPLRKAMELADQEYERLMSSIDPAYYHEFAVPAHIDVPKVVVEELRSLLQLKEEFPGVLGPERVEFGDKQYKVWVQIFPCG